LLALPILAGIFIAASPQNLCGESFCLPSDAKLISRESPVEDFNLYRVQWRSNRFMIYEGNYPQRRSASVVIKTRKTWPAFIEVSSQCGSGRDCGATALAAMLTLRSSSR